MQNPESIPLDGARFGRTSVSVAVGELVDQSVEAIITAGNQRAMIAAGSHSTLWSAAGEDVERELREQAPFELGTAIRTGSGRLDAHGTKIIAHAIIAPGLGERPRNLAIPLSFEAALDLVVEQRLRSVAFPLLGLPDTATADRRTVRASELIEVLLEVLRTRKHRIERAMLISRFDDDRRPFAELIMRARERLWTT